MSTRIVFFGIYGLGARSLRRLAEQGPEVSLVVTRPDAPADRQVVALEAERLGLPVAQPLTLDQGLHDAIAHCQPDLIVVAGYHLRLPATLLALARNGGLNTHLSLLPRYRGPVPYKWAILNGEPMTGVTVHEMTQRFDAGPIVAQRSLPILPDDTADSLFERLCGPAAELLGEAVADIARGRAEASPQDERVATYFSNVTDADAMIEWDRDPPEIERRVRGVTSRPGAWFMLDGQRVTVHEVRVLERRAHQTPGAIVDRDGGTLVVATAAEDVLVRLR